MINLEKNLIYSAEYTLDDKNYICFFKKNDSNDTVTDALTDEILNIKNFSSIYYHNVSDLFKFYKRIYKRNKDKSVFIIKTQSELEDIIKYKKTLRFFEIDDYKLIYSDVVEQSILNVIIDKIQKYTARYIGKESSLIYAEQLKKYNNIFDIISLLPVELLEKNKPFWCNEINSNKFVYIRFVAFNIDQFAAFNKYKMVANVQVSEFQKKAFDVLLDIKNTKHNEYKQQCKNIILNKIADARNTLAEEMKYSKSINDEELLFEIKSIGEELIGIESLLDQHEYIENDYSWWPSILYPVVEDEIPKYPSTEKEEHELTEVYYYYPQYHDNL